MNAVKKGGYRVREKRKREGREKQNSKCGKGLTTGPGIKVTEVVA